MSTGSSRILVTGAAGFIGSHLCEALLQRGDEVIGIDNFDAFYPRADKQRNLAEVRASRHGERAKFLEADITDAGAMNRLFKEHRFSGVIHIAARAGVRPSIEQPAAYARINIEGTTILLEAARTFGVQRFVQASSSSVYGNAPKVPFAETDHVDEPISPYAASKRACELLAHTWHHLYQLPVASLRFFTVFGPRQRPDLAIAKFMERIARGQPIAMFGDGTSSRDYTYIGDIIAGVVAAYDRIESHGCRIWNLGGSHPVTLTHMIDAVAKVVGKPAKIEPMPMQAGDVERTFADVSRSEQELGYRPATPFEKGLEQQWKWLKGVKGL